VAATAINSTLLRYGAKDHYFRAVLCRMCHDVQDGSNSLHKYEEQFPAFADSREYKLLQVTASKLHLILNCSRHICSLYF